MYKHSQLPAKRIRRLTFFSIMGLVLFGCVMISSFDVQIVDVTMFLYLVTFAMSSFCLYMFVDWWWCMSGVATRIYACLTLLLFGIGMNSALSAYARSLFLTDSLQDLQAFYLSPVWEYRVMPELTVMVYLFAFSLGRSLSGTDND